MSIVVTNVGADFTKLGSFGTASAFGENLVASMDRRYLARAAFGRNKDAIQVPTSSASLYIRPVVQLFSVNHLSRSVVHPISKRCMAGF